LLLQTGESGIWPDDAAFREAWLRKPLYAPMNSQKLTHLFMRLNHTFMSSKSESLSFAKPPTVEHIMPQSWIENWPLQDGSKGLDFMALFNAPDDDPRAIATRKRDSSVQTLGNLTLLSDGLNASQSNLDWDQKRPALMKHSLLPINQLLADVPEWDEESILHRGEALFARALTLWPR
jgi:hypothetical protein